MASRYIFSLTVDEISLSVSTATRVALTWDTGTKRSQTWDTIVLLPQGSTPIDQKLVCHHKFNNGTVTPTPTTFRVIDTQMTGEDAVLAHCTLDLADLLSRVETQHFVVPLQSTLDKCAKVILSVSIIILSKRDDEKSATVSCASYTQSSRTGKSRSAKSGSKRSYTSSSWISGPSANETGSDGTSQVSENIDKTSESIFEKISEMESTLAQVEDEMRSDRLKLDQVSRCSGSKYTRMEANLQTNITKKDRQIKILVTQLDEMHAALAVAHQRELERGAILQYPMNIYDDTASKVNTMTSQRSVTSCKHSTYSSVKAPLDVVYNKSYKTNAAKWPNNSCTNYNSIRKMQSPPPEIRPFQGDQIEYDSDAKAPSPNRGNHILSRPPPTVLQANGPMLQNRANIIRKVPSITPKNTTNGAIPRMIPYKASSTSNFETNPCPVQGFKSPAQLGGAKSAQEANANGVAVGAVQKRQPSPVSNACVATPCSNKPKVLATPATTNYPKFGEAGTGLEATKGTECNQPTVVCGPATVKIPQISFTIAKPVLNTPTTQGNGFAKEAKKHVEYLEKDLIETKVAFAHSETDRERQLLELRQSISGA